jgi:hypothetical protein
VVSDIFVDREPFLRLRSRQGIFIRTSELRQRVSQEKAVADGRTHQLSLQLNFRQIQPRNRGCWRLRRLIGIHCVVLLDSMFDKARSRRTRGLDGAGMCVRERLGGRAIGGNRV